MTYQEIKKTFPMELNFKEYCLILALRYEFRHKEVVIMMRDGIPQHIVQAWKSDPLTKPFLTKKNK